MRVKLISTDGAARARVAVLSPSAARHGCVQGRMQRVHGAIQVQSTALETGGRGGREGQVRLSAPRSSAALGDASVRMCAGVETYYSSATKGSRNIDSANRWMADMARGGERSTGLSMSPGTDGALFSSPTISSASRAYERSRANNSKMLAANKAC